MRKRRRTVIVRLSESGGPSGLRSGPLGVRAMQAPSAVSCGRTVSRSEAGGRARVLAALICAQVLVGCGDGSGRSPNDMVAHPPNSPPEAMPAAPPIEGHGRFIGTVTIQ